MLSAQMFGNFKLCHRVTDGVFVPMLGIRVASVKPLNLHAARITLRAFVEEPIRMVQGQSGQTEKQNSRHAEHRQINEQPTPTETMLLTGKWQLV